MSKAFLTRACAIVALFTGSAIAHAVLVVPLPCDDTGKNGLRSCNAFLNGGDTASMLNPTPGASPIPDPGMLNLLRDRFEKQVKALYGYYPDSAAAPYTKHSEGRMLDLDNPPGIKFTVFGPNVCNIVGNDVFGLPPEIQSYALDGQSCGKPLQMGVDLGIFLIEKNVGSCKVLGVGNHMWIKCLGGVDTPTSHLRLDAGFGTQENAYLQGAFVSDLSCFYQGKVNEITTSKNLVIDDINGTDSECLAQSDFYKNLTKKSGEAYQAFITRMNDSGLNGTSQYADIINCKSTWSNDPSALNDPKISSLRQQAQQLCGARYAMEAAFMRLAECQILALTKAAWLNVIVDHLPEFWTGVLQDQVATPCAKFCTKFMSDEVFHVPSNIDSNAKISGGIAGAAWACLKCDTDFSPHSPGSDCDQSAKCPVQPPSVYETRHHFEANHGATTKLMANDDTTACANACYLHGVKGGATVGTAPRSGLPFRVSSFPTVPSYQEAIRTYLEKQWPRAPKVQSDCALTGPRP